ncbi:general stress protein YciG [Lewinella aquimaris]|uniref:General stress protein YciG n=1 Tax=Neolewinella aquimaris TaxID=1835722 RepID=A0A840E5U0_9BACT|nr:periplasmic heavy metal sensor [Neolewinella aquimaris]MBB4079082.1 general stress protein YciG [Neolewinella aquimaris]
MKTTKAILFSLFFVLAVGSVSAQRGGNHDPVAQAEQQTEHLTEVLELTPEQTERVKAINLQFAETVKGAREEIGDERAAMREIVEKANEARREEMKSVLNDEQLVKLEALEADRERRQENGKKGGRKGGKDRS